MAWAGESVSYGGESTGSARRIGSVMNEQVVPVTQSVVVDAVDDAETVRIFFEDDRHDLLGIFSWNEP